MSNIELTSGTQVAEDVLASPPGSVKAEHHSSDDSLAVGSDGMEVTNPFSDGEGNGGSRLYGPCGQALHVPQITSLPRAIRSSNQHTTLELTLAVLDKFIQYGGVYGAVFNHFDQTTQTLKPYAVQCLHQPVHGGQSDDPGLWLLRQS
ncbi:hypothetical protein LTR81_012760 [Elasticomyces elasticus]